MYDINITDYSACKHDCNNGNNNSRLYYLYPLLQSDKETECPSI